MHDPTESSAATFFNRAGAAMDADVVQQLGLEDIRRTLTSPSGDRTESLIAAKARAALGILSQSGTLANAPSDFGTATACFEMHLAGGSVAFLQATVALTNIVPYTILGGTIRFAGEVEVSPWTITGGWVGLPHEPPSETAANQEPWLIFYDSLLVALELRPDPIEGAEAVVADVSIPNQVQIFGVARPPLSYPGFYLFSDNVYEHNTLFKGWQACS
jgi:hypothetical protein